MPKYLFTLAPQVTIDADSREQAIDFMQSSQIVSGMVMLAPRSLVSIRTPRRRMVGLSVIHVQEFVEPVLENGHGSLILPKKEG